MPSTLPMVKSQGRCSNGTALLGNVAEEYLVVSDTECGHHCLMNDRCLSFNYFADDHKCELNSASTGTHLTLDAQATHFGTCQNYYLLHS